MNKIIKLLEKIYKIIGFLLITLCILLTIFDFNFFKLYFTIFITYTFFIIYYKYKYDN